MPLQAEYIFNHKKMEKEREDSTALNQFKLEQEYNEIIHASPSM